MNELKQADRLNNRADNLNARESPDHFIAGARKGVGKLLGEYHVGGQ